MSSSVPRILQIDVPGDALDRTVAFWSAALGGHPVQAPGRFVHLVGASSALEVHLQPLDEGPARYHLDLVADDRDGEIDRLVALGARPGRRVDGYTVFVDPAGLEHCVIDHDAARVTPTSVASDAGGYLHAVFVDVPRSMVDDVVAFWAAALDREARRDDEVYTVISRVTGATGAPLGFEIQAIGAGTPRLHVDLRAADVTSEANRLVALGARREGAHEDWVTLSDPCGNLLCVVPASD